MQKERPQSVKVRRRTPIERTPYLCAAARIVCMMTRTLTVRFRLCMVQSGQPRLQNVQSVHGPRCRSREGSWLVA